MNETQDLNNQLLIAAWIGVHVVPVVRTGTRADFFYRYPWPLTSLTVTHRFHTSHNEQECNLVREHIREKHLTGKYLEYLEECGGSPDDKFGEAVTQAFLKVIEYKCSQFEWIFIQHDDDFERGDKRLQLSIPKDEKEFYATSSKYIYMDTGVVSETGARIFIQIKYSNSKLWSEAWNYIEKKYPEMHREMWGT